jgi:hypothetical protein
VLDAKNLAHCVCEMSLKPQDQALAIRYVLRCGSLPLQSTEFCDVSAQMRHEPI